MTPLIIRWHGHSCFELESGVTVVVDPHNGRGIGIRPPKLRADVVLITHDHFDHNAVHMVTGVRKVFREPGTFSFKGIEFTGIPAYHDREKGSKRGKITMFKINMEGLSILHMGDIGHIPTQEMLESIGNVDIVMLPVGGKYTIEPEEAKKTIYLINPKVAIPMHYRIPGLSLSLKPIEDFTSLFSPEKIMYMGKEVELERSDLPTSIEIWVFSY